MKIKGIKTIVWDLDGTIIDSFGVFADITQQVLEMHGHTVPTTEILAKNFHGSLEDSVSNSAGGLTADELGLVMIDFLRLQNEHYEAIEHHILSDALNLAKQAHTRGIQQIVVTNRAHRGRLNGSPKNIVSASSLKGLIDQVICGDDGVHRKPLIEVFGGSPPEGSTTLVIGDQHVDILFANNLNARAVIVQRGSEELVHSDKLHQDWMEHTTIVKSLDEVELT